MGAGDNYSADPAASDGPAEDDAGPPEDGEAERRQRGIEARHNDLKNRIRASAAFADWQLRMEGIQTRAGKRNIVNTYVWDGDGGLRAEQQRFASTVEHTLTTEVSETSGGGFKAETMIFGICVDLSFMRTSARNTATSKRLSTARSLELSVDLSGAGRPNKCWRVLHRVTHVERPVLLRGVSLEPRELNTLAVTTPNPLARQAELVARLDGLEEKLDEILAKLGQG